MNKKSKKGFTLIEVMMSASIFTIGLAGILGVYATYLKNSNTSALWQTADTKASLAIEKMLRGSASTIGLRQFSRLHMTCTRIGNDWRLIDDESGEGYAYSSQNKTIIDDNGNIIADDVISSYVTFDGTLLTVSVKISKSSNTKNASMYWTSVQLRNG